MDTSTRQHNASNHDASRRHCVVTYTRATPTTEVGMSRISIYLNFMGKTEEAFTFYRSVFGGEFIGLQRMGEVPTAPGQPELPEHERQLLMHIELPILDGTILMGTDMLESMGHQLQLGNNISINIEPDTLAETQRIFDALSEGATDVMPLNLMFWGAYWGTFVDRYSIRWMFNCPEQPA